MKQKAILIKDFYNDKGALHRGEKVTIEGDLLRGLSELLLVQVMYIISHHILLKNY